jgi:F-type H+-transporting ATPase subunit gamma
MESLQNLKRRLRGVQNIGTITKAMELVAATKMRKSQELALNSRAYALTALRFLATLSGLGSAKMPSLLVARPIKKTMLVVVSSDKGLAGSFNSSVFRDFEKFARKEGVDFMAGERYLFIAVGEKSRAFLERKGVRPLRTFVRVGDYTTPEETRPIADMLADGYVRGEWDEVIVFSANFVSALVQKIMRRRIFPVNFNNLKETAEEMIPKTGRFAEMAKEIPSYFLEGAPSEYLIEPSPDIVLDMLARHLVEMQLYHLILEANASEHAARRVAMKNASDNAAELSSDLNLLYNKSRQAAITQEITEITAGVEALK